MDYGERYSDKKISAVNRDLRKTYRTAQAELKKKLSDFEKRFAAKNKQKKLELEAGKISKQDYKDWLTGQVFIRTQFEQNIKKVNAVLLDCNRQALNIINNARFDVFAENYNYNAWKAEREIAVSFNVYSAESVARLMLDDPQLLPKWKIDEKKDYIWNYNKVNNIVRQGIIQGEGVPEITERLCNGLASSNESKMRMFARTAINSAQNAGRQKQMEDAAAMGIDVAKRWIATRDSRTRDAHRDLDGKEVPYDKPFKSQLGDIMFPGDPTAPAANVFNCRCTMVTIYPKYEDRSKQWGEGDTVEGVPYEEWKKGKKARGEVKTTGESNGYQPDKFDKEFETLDKRIEEAKEKQRTERAKEIQEMTDLYKEIQEYRGLRTYSRQDVSAYEKIKTKEDYDNYRKGLTDEIEELRKQYDAIRSNRIRSEDYATEEEYNRAFEEYLTKKTTLKDEIYDKETELYNMKEWGFIEKTRKAQNLGDDEISRRIEEKQERYAELDARQYKDSDEVKNLQNSRTKYGIEYAAKWAQDNGVEWITPKKSAEPFDMEKVIEKLAGADKTEGCCASLAFAYVGQRGGYDVIDYRGGNSRVAFSYQCRYMLKSMKENGISAAVGTAKSYITAGKRALKTVQEGKEYYFECGSHAAMVRMVNGDLQYLEMQSGYRPNTWYSFSQYGLEETLKWRFGAGRKTGGWDVESYLVDAEEMAKDKRFLKILGYINTNPDKQMKGEGGGEK